MNRKELAAALLKSKMSSEEICAFGMALLAHGCSTKGETVQDSIDCWRALAPTLPRQVEAAIRQNWDKLRS